MSPSEQMHVVDMWIDGESVPALSGATFDSSNPYLQKRWAIVADGDASDVDRAVRAAKRTFQETWSTTTGFERASLLRRVADAIEENAVLLAKLEVADSGKLYREMLGQMKSLASWFTYYGGLADKLEGRQIPVPNPNYLVYTRREPIGVVAAITPWNSPLMLLAWKLAPALAAGCTVVIKPSEHAAAATVAFAQLFDQVGFPPGVVNVLTGATAGTGAALTNHPEVDKVAFTGSTAAGKLVARAAAENLRSVTLELGGKSPQIVFPDADLAAAANGVIAGIFAAAGQTCMAGSRLLVHESVSDELVRLVVARAEAIVLGDPLDPETEMGPIANQPQYDKVMHYIELAKREGATVRCGGADGNLGGYFVKPTVLTGLDHDATVIREEIFGPVLSVNTFSTEAEAIRLANDTDFGLAASVWTKDVHRGHRVAAKVRAGTVWVNAYRAVSPSVPFGGFQLSGIGRENGADAINEFTETKAVWIELSGETRDPFVLG